MIMWLEADGKAKLDVDDWNGSGKWSSGTKRVKAGGTNGALAPVATSKCPGHSTALDRSAR